MDPRFEEHCERLEEIEREPHAYRRSAAGVLYGEGPHDPSKPTGNAPKRADPKRAEALHAGSGASR